MLPASIAPSDLPAPTIVCISSMKQHDAAFALPHLLEHGLEPLLELAAVLRARDQRTHVEREHGLVLQAFGHVTAHDALRETLRDRGLADAGLTDQDGIVSSSCG